MRSSYVRWGRQGDLDDVRQLIAVPLGTGQIGVGLIVSGKSFCLGVPFQVAANRAGNVGQVTDRASPMTTLHISHWLLPGINGANPVLKLANSLVLADRRTFREGFMRPGPSPRDWISRSNAPA